MSKLKTLLVNISISALSLVFLFLCLEFVVFRFILVAADQPKIDFVDGVVKYRPNQQGVYRIKDEIKAEYRINADGWNSKHPDYTRQQEDNTYRIAVIGDSYVEALQVDFNQSLAERLENKFSDQPAQVYRFAISGAPLSQYLYILRQEVVDYSPNLVVLVLVHNDFSESYRFSPGVYTSSFLKIKLDGETVAGETPPKAYRPPWYSFIRESATWRYLAYRQKVQFQTLRNIISRPGNNAQPKYQANIDVSTLDDRSLQDEVVTDYIFRQAREITGRIGAELLIVMDGDRSSIYNHVDSRQLYESGSLRLNAMAKSVAQKYNIHFIDLHPVFQEDYSINQKRLSFQNDGHWNAYAHELVANVIFDYINQHVKN